MIWGGNTHYFRFNTHMFGNGGFPKHQALWNFWENRQAKEQAMNQLMEVAGGLPSGKVMRDGSFFPKNAKLFWTFFKRWSCCEDVEVKWQKISQKARVQGHS